MRAHPAPVDRNRVRGVVTVRAGLLMPAGLHLRLGSASLPAAPQPVRRKRETGGGENLPERDGIRASGVIREREPDDGQHLTSGRNGTSNEPAMLRSERSA